jgi:aryl-alcohol dehydrogenase-like predicted oxidoreductase
MERRTLGPNGFEVPVVGMGTSRTFDVRGRAAEATSRRIVEEALDVGANLFDSSPMYGEAERVLGLALDGRRGRSRPHCTTPTAGSSCTRSTTWSPGQPGWTGWRSSATRA